MSWGTVVSAVVSGASSYYSSKQKSKAAEKSREAGGSDLRSPELIGLGDDYVSTLKSAIGEYKPGADFGDVSVGLTDPEQKSLGYLDKYLDSDVRESDLYKMGRGQITGTLEGKYDPSTGEYYKATRAGMESETQQAIDAARRGQAARGSYRSSGGLRQEGDILTQSTLGKQQLLASLAEKERERRAVAGGQALKLAEFETNIPLTKTQMAQKYGSLERENEMLNLDREYNKWRNQRAELMDAFTKAGSASNEGQPLYMMPSGASAKEGSGSSAMMSSLGGLFSSYMSSRGGGAGSSAGAGSSTGGSNYGTSGTTWNLGGGGSGGFSGGSGSYVS